jgi:DNA polymerase bacteriophage-type
MVKNAPATTIDFETRSACSLKKSGSWRYSIDPSTQILCLCFRLPHWPVGRVETWHPSFPSLGIDEAFPDAIGELVQWIEQGGLIEAHNAAFERCIWTNILAPRYGWPAIGVQQWRCSAAKAAACALPRELEDVGLALTLIQQKDIEGHKLMLKLSKPRKSRKKEREEWAKAGLQSLSLLWHESAELFQRLFAYCKQDVLVESELSERLPDLNPHETQVYTMDQRINQRGFQLDTAAVQIALKLIATESIALNSELAKVTNGKVTKATQRAQMLKWFESEGLDLPDTQKETIDAQLQRYEGFSDCPAKRGLEIMRALGRSSTAKYQTMREWVGMDGRVRGGLLYHGASTGRWSGSGVQPHNFVRGTVKDMDGLWASLKDGSYVGDVMQGLSQALRGAIVAGPGKTLYVADYAAIEARVVLWLAGDDDALGIFRRDEDIYCSMAETIYGYPCTKKDNDRERQVGKIAILGLGYQMGVSKFQATAEAAGQQLTEEQAKEVVDAYRARFYRVKQLWWDTEAAAINAVNVRKTGRKVTLGSVSWTVEGDFLYCELPSGRRLSYPFPKVTQKATPWGEMRPQLTFMGIDPYTRKLKRQHTYGGSLVENITQAVARDIMADAMLRIEASGTYQIILTCHDEILAEAEENTGAVKEFERLMAECPEWAAGCPIKAEGFSATRYRK